MTLTNSEKEIRDYSLETQNTDKKEYYICGQPAMIGALQETLSKYNIQKLMSLYDEF